MIDRSLHTLAIRGLRAYRAMSRGRAGSTMPRNRPGLSISTRSGKTARRFTDLVGEPPMAFLTDWRLSLAADLLRTGDETLASVARRVGYGTPFSLSGAFKRRYGLSPQDFRRGQRPA